MMGFFINFLIFANVIVLALIHGQYRKDMKRMSENDKIRADFEEFLRTGNDKPWGRGK
jgi:hypothetical protein